MRNTRYLASILLCISITFLFIFLSGLQLPDIVKTENGMIAGTVGMDPSVTVFKGIPFAAAPVGDLRWKPPQPAVDWDGTLEASSFSDGCIQPLQRSRPPWTEEFMHQGDASEDCLYLNIWTTAQAGDAHPVLVYIHGGGFNEGSGSVAVYDGEALAKKNLVVVTINYRLGVLGFLAHTELTAESTHKASGNYGLLDQVAALEWIQRNIAAFGGDPNNVTIAGQSAGAVSVYLLTASTLAKGLIHRAIVQSGPGGLASFGLTSTHSIAGPLAEGETAGARFAEAKGATTIADLRSMSVEALIATEDNVSMRFGPVADGYFLNDDVAAVYAAGNQNDVPMLSGFNADEGSAFPGYGKSTVDRFRTMAETRYEASAETFLELYNVSTDEEAGEAQKVSMRDIAAVAIQKLAAERAATAQTPEYLYYFERAIPWPEYPVFQAFHTGEVPYVFNTLHLMERPWEDLDYQLADQTSSYWANFATHGDPNGEGLPEWPTYQHAPRTVMVLGETVGPVQMPQNAGRRAFFEKQLAQ